nr:unnamed protein product [Callosobruchus chinensis]
MAPKLHQVLAQEFTVADLGRSICPGSAGRQLKLRNTSSSIVLPCAEEEARIWKLKEGRQIRPSLEYCSHIWGAAAPTSLSILDAVQRKAIRLIGDPALTCHLQPFSHRRAVGDL